MPYPSHEDNKAYDALLLAVMEEWRSMPFLSYFVARTRRLWVYSHNNFRMSPALRPSFSLERYEDGVRVSRAEWKLPAWLPAPLKYAVMYAGYAYVAACRLPSDSWVITLHPLFCVGRSALKSLKGLRVAYWVWDHCEDEYPTYSAFDDHAVRQADAALFVSRPMLPAYAGRAPAARPSQSRAFLPHGTMVHDAPRRPVDGLIGFIGNARPDDGLLRVIDALALDPTLRLELITDGPFMPAVRAHVAAAGAGDRVVMHGRVTDPARIDDITASWQIGMAPYAATAFTRYGDPGKLKLYLQQGLPVVTTAVVPFASEVAAERAGEVVPDEDPAGLVAAIRRIRDGYASYGDGVRRLNGKYAHVRLYDEGFAFMRS